MMQYMFDMAYGFLWDCYLSLFYTLFDSKRWHEIFHWMTHNVLSNVFFFSIFFWINDFWIAQIKIPFDRKEYFIFYWMQIPLCKNLLLNFRSSFVTEIKIHIRRLKSQCVCCDRKEWIWRNREKKIIGTSSPWPVVNLKMHYTIYFSCWFLFYSQFLLFIR